MSVPAEHRRRHMLTLVSELRTLYGLPLEEARRTASMMVGLVETKLAKGLEIDFGCCKIAGKPIKPRHYRFNLKGADQATVYQGESFKWSIKFSRAWLKKTRPKWSHV